MLEYDRHASNTANRLRTQLLAFDPSEAEYQSIFRQAERIRPALTPMLQSRER